MCGLDPNVAGDPDRVLEHSQQWIPVPNALTDYLYAIGRAYYRAGDCEKGIEWLHQALEKKTANAEPLIYLDLALAHHKWADTTRPENGWKKQLGCSATAKSGRRTATRASKSKFSATRRRY